MKTKDYIVIKDNKIIMTITQVKGCPVFIKRLPGKEYDKIQEFNGNPLKHGVYTQK